MDLSSGVCIAGCLVGALAVPVGEGCRQIEVAGVVDLHRGGLASFACGRRESHEGHSECMAVTKSIE